jgi:hypothetical protein
MYLVMILMLIIVVYQIPQLYQQKSYKEMAVFMGLWLISEVYALIVALDISLISPFELITIVIEQFYAKL